jgi:hypothetical protein
VRVLSDDAGTVMVQRLSQVYAHLTYPNFDHQSFTMSYFPKEFIAMPQKDGGYQFNKKFFDEIKNSLPAVIDVVRDPNLWLINGKPIRDIIGSDLTVSHTGLLYRQSFHKGDVIYHKTTCQFDSDKQKVCRVQPITCQTETCDELMFTHATDAFPNGYFWYQKNDGSYTCTASTPSSGPVTTCNRVTSIPLFDYLTDYQYATYWYMKNPSILGIHIEALKQ